MKTLFSEIKAAGIPHSSHESDLYVPDTEAVRAILAHYPDQQAIATRFINQAPPHVGERWIDIPFAFLPWWEARTSKEPRPELSFDGLGINGPDQHRTRIATFADSAAAKKYGPLFEAAPEILSALQSAANCLERLIEKHGENFRPWVTSLERARAAIAKADRRTE